MTDTNSTGTSTVAVGTRSPAPSMYMLTFRYSDVAQAYTESTPWLSSPPGTPLLNVNRLSLNAGLNQNAVR